MAKFIARKSFRNNVSPRLEIPDADNEYHVHKGAIFELGSDARGNALPLEKLKDMAKADQRLIAELNLAECIADATKPEIVKMIQAEVAAEKRADELAISSQKAAGSSADLIAQLIAALRPAKTA